MLTTTGELQERQPPGQFVVDIPEIAKQVVAPSEERAPG